MPVGMSPPVDCRLAEGSPATSFDEAPLTGESRPVGKKVGDTVYAGTHNTGPSAAMVIAETHDGETVIDSIASGVRDAMSKKASIERFADAVTAIFVPFIVGASILVFALWMIRAYSGHVPEEWLDDQKAGGWTLFALQFTVATLIVGEYDCVFYSLLLTCVSYFSLPLRSRPRSAYRAICRRGTCSKKRHYAQWRR